MMKYPVKYAIQTHYSKPNYTCVNTSKRPLGYTVSKVYVIEQKISYNDTGDRDESYLVVYPFASDLDIEDNVRNVPKYNIDGVCYNGIFVDDVYDTYEEALSIKQECYRTLFFEEITSVYNYSLYEDRDSFAQDFFDRAQLYDLYEELSLGLTEDMEVITDTKNKQKKYTKLV